MTGLDPMIIKQALCWAAAKFEHERGSSSSDTLVFLRYREFGVLDVAYLVNMPLPERVEAEVFLHKVAEMAEAGAISVTKFIEDQPDLYGLGVLVNGWVTEMTIEQAEERPEPDDWTGSPAEGFVPCQLTTVIDLYGQVFNVECVKGEKPFAAEWGNIDDGIVLGSPVEGLRRLFIQFLKAMPSDPERAEAIERLSMMTPTNREAAAVVRLRANQDKKA